MPFFIFFLLTPCHQSLHLQLSPLLFSLSCSPVTLSPHVEYSQGQASHGSSSRQSASSSSSHHFPFPSSSRSVFFPHPSSSSFFPAPFPFYALSFSLFFLSAFFCALSSCVWFKLSISFLHCYFLLYNLPSLSLIFFTLFSSYSLSLLTLLCLNYLLAVPQCIPTSQLCTSHTSLFYSLSSRPWPYLSIILRASLLGDPHSLSLFFILYYLAFSLPLSYLSLSFSSLVSDISLFFLSFTLLVGPGLSYTSHPQPPTCIHPQPSFHVPRPAPTLAPAHTFQPTAALTPTLKRYSQRLSVTYSSFTMNVPHLIRKQRPIK